MQHHSWFHSLCWLDFLFFFFFSSSSFPCIHFNERIQELKWVWMMAVEWCFAEFVKWKHSSSQWTHQIIALHGSITNGPLSLAQIILLRFKTNDEGSKHAAYANYRNQEFQFRQNNPFAWFTRKRLGEFVVNCLLPGTLRLSKCLFALEKLQQQQQNKVKNVNTILDSSTNPKLNFIWFRSLRDPLLLFAIIFGSVR